MNRLLFLLVLIAGCQTQLSSTPQTNSPSDQTQTNPDLPVGAVAAPSSFNGDYRLDDTLHSTTLACFTIADGQISSWKDGCNDPPVPTTDSQVVTAQPSRVIVVVTITRTAGNFKYKISFVQQDDGTLKGQSFATNLASGEVTSNEVTATHL